MYVLAYVTTYKYAHHNHESWLAVKDSLTHRPSFQGWAPGVLLPCCVVLYVCVCVFVFMWVMGEGGSFLSFLVIWLVCYIQ